MALSPAIRQRLARVRLVAAHTLARGGVGERRSALRGEGIEFEQHRPFETGDDARRIDPHLYARLGAPFVREYAVGQALTVTLLLDASRSMAAGAPPKLAFARDLVTGLAAVALAGADAVQAAVVCDDRLWRRPRRTGAAALADLERWWGAFAPRGGSDLVAAVDRLRDDLPPFGLTVVVSDFWSEGAEAALSGLASARQAVVAIQVLAPEEVEPARYGHEGVRMVDLETEEEVEVALGAPQLARYDALLTAWTETLRRRTLAARGTFVRLTSDGRPEDVFFRVLPAAGVLR